jgi:TRAP-type mannitol/chloroaromatic compound transport system substrate-binding protein
MMKKIIRRNFIKTASTAALAAGAIGISGCENNENTSISRIDPSETFKWKMVTTWPPNFPILGEFALKFSELVEKESAGRLKIHVYGGGELVPPFEVFDAVSQGMAEMGHGASYYWAGKTAAAQFFTTVPFGMNTQQFNAWLYNGGGLQLWQELYNNFNLIPFPCGNTGAQMGGWFRKEINSISDIRGLKWRIAGLGGKVVSKAGATSILVPAGELYTNLERGVIDALEWIGPFHDYIMGFHKIASYYYYPGWQEPTAALELIVNKSAYNRLPEDLKKIIETVSARLNIEMLSETEAKNSEYYHKMKEEG